MKQKLMALYVIILIGLFGVFSCAKVYDLNSDPGFTETSLKGKKILLDDIRTVEREKISGPELLQEILQNHKKKFQVYALSKTLDEHSSDKKSDIMHHLSEAEYSLTDIINDNPKLFQEYDYIIQSYIIQNAVSRNSRSKSRPSGYNDIGGYRMVTDYDVTTDYNTIRFMTVLHKIFDIQSKKEVWSGQLKHQSSKTKSIDTHGVSSFSGTPSHKVLRYNKYYPEPHPPETVLKNIYNNFTKKLAKYFM